ncbi:pyridoxal phosphate-dependent aminotransferase [Anaerolentibacter hominis]|uniref:pyridoxal phosphate-dependent aminotransferase n=1 Tax=Anaerolentibacter hominis TaxID=3079009 RepID=UPI0031B86F24
MNLKRYNENIDGLKPSASLVIMDKARSMQAAGQDIISLAGGEPDCVTPEKICDALKASIDRGNTHYVAGKGILPLREKIAEKLTRENKIECTPEDILVTPGGKYGIYLGMTALLNPGEEVLIMDPSWVSYAPIASACGAVPVAIGLSYEDNYKITKEALYSHYTDKTKMLVINTPNNPTGRMLSREEADTIAAFIKDTDIYVVADEVYEKVCYDGNEHISIASYPEVADKSVTMNGFSKCVAMTGWRLGYITAAPDLMKRIYKLSQHTTTCVSGFIQEAALAAFDCEEEMEQMRLSYDRRRALFVNALNTIPGVTCRMPEGAFYAWTKIDKDNMSSMELADFLLDKAGVACIPGDAYGLGGENCVRFSFSASDQDLVEAAERIRKALS